MAVANLANFITLKQNRKGLSEEKVLFKKVAIFYGITHID